MNIQHFVVLNSISFEQTINLLKIEVKQCKMLFQMVKEEWLQFGANIEIIKKILKENKDKFQCYIANDNSKGQIVVSGKTINLRKFKKIKKKKYKIY